MLKRALRVDTRPVSWLASQQQKVAKVAVVIVVVLVERAIDRPNYLGEAPATSSSTMDPPQLDLLTPWNKPIKLSSWPFRMLNNVWNQTVPLTLYCLLFQLQVTLRGSNKSIIIKGLTFANQRRNPRFRLKNMSPSGQLFCETPTLLVGSSRSEVGLSQDKSTLLGSCKPKRCTSWKWVITALQGLLSSSIFLLLRYHKSSSSIKIMMRNVLLFLSFLPCLLASPHSLSNRDAPPTLAQALAGQYDVHLSKR